MKYKSAFKKDVREVCKMLRTEFYVHEREFDIKWNSEDDVEDGRRTMAKIPIDNRYLTFTVEVYPALQTEWERSKDYFLKVLIHEFSHLITEPLYTIAARATSEKESDFLEDIREQQTERIAIILAPFITKKLITNHKTNARKPKPRRPRRKRN